MYLIQKITFRDSYVQFIRMKKENTTLAHTLRQFLSFCWTLSVLLGSCQKQKQELNIGAFTYAISQKISLLYESSVLISLLYVCSPYPKSKFINCVNVPFYPNVFVFRIQFCFFSKQQSYDIKLYPRTYPIKNTILKEQWVETEAPIFFYLAMSSKIQPNRCIDLQRWKIYM